jgi:hypothetical protein
MISMFCMYQHSRRICNDSASRTSNNYGIGVGEKLNSTNHNLKTVMMGYEDGKPLRVKGKIHSSEERSYGKCGFNSKFKRKRISTHQHRTW